jgi:hypothetical protein
MLLRRKVSIHGAMNAPWIAPHSSQPLTRSKVLNTFFTRPCKMSKFWMPSFARTATTSTPGDVGKSHLSRGLEALRRGSWWNHVVTELQLDLPIPLDALESPNEERSAPGCLGEKCWSMHGAKFGPGIVPYGPKWLMRTVYSLAFWHLNFLPSLFLTWSSSADQKVFSLGGGEHLEGLQGNTSPVLCKGTKGLKSE